MLDRSRYPRMLPQF